MCFSRHFRVKNVPLMFLCSCLSLCFRLDAPVAVVRSGAEKTDVVGVEHAAVEIQGTYYARQKVMTQKSRISKTRWIIE